MARSGVHVHVDGLRKSYGSVTALAGVDLELRPGVTGLLGPNGAGKSTLLRILATLLPPSDGTVRVDAWDVTSLRERVEVRRRLGYLPQDLGLYPRFTGVRVRRLSRHPQGAEGPARAAPARPRRAGGMGLADLAGRKLKTLSEGMRRRVGIAQAIVADPDLLLLDEPTAGLDPEQRMRFRELIARLGEERTVLLSTHLVEDIAAICHAVVVLWRGEVWFSGTPGELRHLADGWVWRAPAAAADAVTSWRTEDGSYRVVGPRPSRDAVPVPPTVEDGYLWLTAGASSAAAA